MEIEEIRNQFNNTERLYHYTTFNNAIKILQSHTLLFGRLKDMNDINELYRPLAFEYHPDNHGNKEEFEKMSQDFFKYQQISLTMDGARFGFDIPAMWGHYADKGNGVCLVFDRSKLLNIIDGDRSRRFIYGKVKYTKDYSPVVIYRTNNGSIVRFSKKEEKDFFYHKTKDWQYEQEFRILIKSDLEAREKLDFGDSLTAIIMHNAESVGHEQSIFDSIEFRIIDKITGSNIPVLEHSMWFENTQLTIREDMIWTSNPIDANNIDV